MNHLADSIRRQLRLWEVDERMPLWHAGEPVVVGVSGGPDSLTLLHLFVEGGLHPRDKIIAAHLDHQLRPESRQEAETVARLCKAWGVACQTGRADVAKIARKRRESIEQAARSLRYRFLKQVADRAGSGFIVTGHTRDDQAETVLMHLIRGSGTRGLQGMRPLRRLPGASTITLVRPLLAVSRADVEAYSDAHNLHPLTDPTNKDPIYFRNRIRHELLPQLELLNPQIRERLSSLADVVRADVDLLNLQTMAALRASMRPSESGAVRLDRLLWRQLPLSLRRRTLRKAAKSLNPTGEVSYASLEQARRIAEHGEVGAQSSLAGELTLMVDYETVLIARRDNSSSGELPQLDKSQPLQVPGALPLNEQWLLETRLLSSIDPNPFQKEPLTEYVDADKAGQLQVRSRLPGDRMQPLGLAGKTAKLSDIMINQRIPERFRARLPVVTNQEHVVWVVGVGIDERVRIISGTQRVLQLRCRRR